MTNFLPNKGRKEALKGVKANLNLLPEDVEMVVSKDQPIGPLVPVDFEEEEIKEVSIKEMPVSK
jgi:hypothetical protein